MRGSAIGYLEEKGRVLEGSSRVIGYHRKSGIRLLATT